MIYRGLASHSNAVKTLITILASKAGVAPQTYFEQNIPDHLKNNSENVLNFVQVSTISPFDQGMATSATELNPHELYIKNLQSQPQEVIDYIRNRAGNYPGFSAQELFDKVPDHLKDNPAEILDFLSKNHGDSIGMEVSHIRSQVNHPHLTGDANNILLETTVGNPNQVRQGFDMSDMEIEQVFTGAKERALSIEYQHTGDNQFFTGATSEHFTSNSHGTVDLALSNNYDGLTDSIHFGLESLAASLGVALSYAVIKTYTPRIIAILRYLISHRQTLIKDASSREKFVRDYLMPLVKAENADQLGVSFIVGLILACIPGIRELLLVYGLVSLCKLALHHVEKFINYVARRYPTLAKLLHWVVGGINQLVNALHLTLTKLWQLVEKVADTAWKTVKRGVQVAKDCLFSFFNWSWNKVKSLFSGNQPQLNPA
jgi:hypothetical protein